MIKYFGPGLPVELQTTVAVKRITKDNNQSAERERYILTKFSYHPNIIKLLAYAESTKEDILLFEFHENGDLRKYLSDCSGAGELILTWKQRLNIITGIAKALACLHNREPNKPAFHRDINPANIVLDKNHNPILIDLGSSKYADTQNEAGKAIISLQGSFFGTKGYLCHHYANTGIFDVKSEIYSFGVLLLEIIMGQIGTKKVLSMTCSTIHSKANQVIENADQSIDWDENVLKKLADIVVQCIKPYEERIATMTIIVEDLMTIGSNCNQDYNLNKAIVITKKCNTCDRAQQICYGIYCGDHLTCVDCLVKFVTSSNPSVWLNNDKSSYHCYTCKV